MFPIVHVHRALEGQCLAISTCLSNQTKPQNYLFFKTSFESSRVTQASLLLIYKGKCWCVCLFVCLFSIEIQTTGRIRMKFCTEVVLKGGGEGSWRGFDPVPPPPGYRVHKGGTGCLWSLTVHFGKNFIKQKLNHPRQCRVTQASLLIYKG